MRGWGSNVRTTGVRNLAKGRGLQDDPRYGGEFKKSRIDQHQRQSDFSIYRSLIEGSPHGGGHVVTGGSRGHMGDGMSPLDPIFWLHHCNVDRLWAEWQKAGNTTPALGGNYANNFVDAKGDPVTSATAANAVDIAPFGYTYDVLTVAALSTTMSRLALQPFENQTVLRPSAVGGTPRKFGENATAQTARMRLETRIPVATKELLTNLFQSRTYWATDVLGVKRLAAEPGRVLARLSGVVPPETPTPMVVNVFANCPYLSPDTDSNDLHYAGSFSFFGTHAGHGDGIYVDMTNALRGLAADGRIATDTVNVQLMPLPIDPEARATFSVGAVELLAT